MGPALSAPDGVPLWLDQVVADDVVRPRPGVSREPPDRAAQVDVVVVGAGLTGLWTAYYLTEADPDLSVLVVEARTVGFGASGRNGGWCSALFPVSAEALARRHGRDAARRMRAAMRDTVIEVGGVTAAEGIDCDFALGGTVSLARSRPQLARAGAEAAAGAPWGDEVELLPAQAARERVGATRVLGGTWTPDCARVHPGRLVHGLAHVVEGRGVRIAEGTRVVDVRPGRVLVRHADGAAEVRARHVVRATEAWTATLRGSHRDLAPVYSLMVATAQLPEPVWDQIGLARRETFTDGRHLIVDGQRTADDRLAFGGRGAPYHWLSRLEPEHDVVPRGFAALERPLHELFPVLGGTEVTHRGGGPLGIARDWTPSVGLDQSTGMAWAGGYVGYGL
ncbi:MAG: dependent oxidoreductase, partial [Actinotalea sp.]|nr:dependent oxidoreductase [Actinotalea sp.]